MRRALLVCACVIGSCPAYSGFVHSFQLRGLPLVVGSRLLHMPEALEACVPRFRIETAHAPQGEATDAVTALTVRFASGRARRVRLVSEGRLCSNVFWLNSNGRTLLSTRLELEDDGEQGCVLRMTTRRCVDARAEAPLLLFFGTLEQRASQLWAFALVCERLYRDGPLARHRMLIFGSEC